MSNEMNLELCDYLTLGAYFISIEFFRNPED